MKSVNLFSHWERTFLLLVLRYNKLYKKQYNINITEPYKVPITFLEQVKYESETPIYELISTCKELQNTISNLENVEDSRKIFLLKQIEAIETGVRILGGDTISYSEQIHKFFDIHPRKIDEELFEHANSKLDALLPGTGSIKKRMIAYRQELYIPKKKLKKILNLCKKEIRSRTQEIISFPKREGIKIQFVKNESWDAYNWYLGNYFSLIEFNTDTKWQILRLPRMLSHEAYPGHHTERCLKEKLLLREKGYIEHCFINNHSTEALISEGIAMVALNMIFQEKEYSDFVYNSLLPLLNKDINIDLTIQIDKEREIFSNLSANCAYLLYIENRPEKEVVDYFMKYGLTDRIDAEKGLTFIKDPVWNSYIFNYSIGKKMIEVYLGDPPDRQRYIELLTKQFLPSQLIKGKENEIYGTDFLI